jgi:hypothetical protein
MLYYIIAVKFNTLDIDVKSDGFCLCAGSENRTRVSTLGRSHATTIPYPHFYLLNTFFIQFQKPWSIFPSISIFLSLSSTIVTIFSPSLAT